MIKQLLIITTILVISECAIGQSIDTLDKNVELSDGNDSLFGEGNSVALDMSKYQSCFDTSMSIWFHSFFLLQEEGYNMTQADFIAINEAKEILLNCNEATSKKETTGEPLISQ